MKTLITKISSESNSNNYDNEGKANGQSSNLNYRIVIKEENTEVGSVNIQVSSSYYNNNTDEEYISAKSIFEEKIKNLIEELKSNIIIQ